MTVVMSCFLKKINSAKSLKNHHKLQKNLKIDNPILLNFSLLWPHQRATAMVSGGDADGPGGDNGGGGEGCHPPLRLRCPTRPRFLP